MTINSDQLNKCLAKRVKEEKIFHEEFPIGITGIPFSNGSFVSLVTVSPIIFFIAFLERHLISNDMDHVVGGIQPVPLWFHSLW